MSLLSIGVCFAMRSTVPRELGWIPAIPEPLLDFPGLTSLPGIFPDLTLTFVRFLGFWIAISSYSSFATTLFSVLKVSFGSILPFLALALLLKAISLFWVSSMYLLTAFLSTRGFSTTSYSHCSSPSASPSSGDPKGQAKKQCLTKKEKAAIVVPPFIQDVITGMILGDSTIVFPHGYGKGNARMQFKQKRSKFFRSPLWAVRTFRYCYPT